MISQADVRAIAEAIGEDFLVDIPAEHDGKGGYKIDYFAAVKFLLDPPKEWIDRLTGWVNTKELLGTPEPTLTHYPDE